MISVGLQMKLFQDVTTADLLHVKAINFFLYREKQWWGTSFYYVCNRAELQELLVCLVRQVGEICGFFEKCYECEILAEIRRRLENAYFFKKERMHLSQRLVGRYTRFH